MNSDPQIAWAAGVFEGEGCFTNTYTSLGLMQLRMTDLDVVQKFRDIMGYGNIIEEPILPSGKRVWIWRVAKRKEVYRMIEMILPYLMSRRAYKAQNILDDFDNKYPIT